MIDAARLAEFEHYAKLWIPLVEKFGGKHHGYFLPCLAAFEFAKKTNCIVSYERSFMRPVFS